MSRSTLFVRFDAKIVLGGPAHLEQSARIRLEQVLYAGYADGYAGDDSFDGLSACYYLDQSGQAAVWAKKIAESVPYQVRGRKIVIGLVSVDVLYHNNGPIKWWARIRNSKATRDPGDRA